MPITASALGAPRTSAQAGVGGCSDVGGVLLTFYFFTVILLWRASPLHMGNPARGVRHATLRSRIAFIVCVPQVTGGRISQHVRPCFESTLARRAKFPLFSQLSPFFPIFCLRFGDPQEGRGDVAIPPTGGPPRRQGFGSLGWRRE